MRTLFKLLILFFSLCGYSQSNKYIKINFEITDSEGKLVNNAGITIKTDSVRENKIKGEWFFYETLKNSKGTVKISKSKFENRSVTIDILAGKQDDEFFNAHKREKIILTDQMTLKIQLEKKNVLRPIINSGVGK